MPLTRSNGRLHGPGVFDMKAGIGIAMLATRALLETGARVPHRLVMLWTTDEEIGSASSRAAIEDEARRSAAGPGPRAVAAGRRGEDLAKGLRPVPSSWCAASRRMPASIRRRAPARFASSRTRSGQLYSIPTQPDGVSLNVGTIAGGSRANVVADEARAVIDVRAATRRPDAGRATP